MTNYKKNCFKFKKKGFDDGKKKKPKIRQK